MKIAQNQWAVIENNDDLVKNEISIMSYKVGYYRVW